MSYYLGIDGGGSKTTCALGDETSLIATVTTGPSNITRVGEKRARESLHQAIREGCAAAGISPQEVRRACIGIAGAGREVVATAVKKMVAEVVAAKIEVVGDMPIALQAAFGAGPGVVVIAGTGSFAYGRDAQGRIARAGGWGFAISDEGSAHWIGRVAVSNLLRAIDQKIDKQEEQRAGPDLQLFREMKALWKLESLDELVRTANSTPDFAALFPAILLASDRGDAVAQNVLTQAGRELAQLAGIVERRLFTENDVSLSAVGVALAGGVFRHSQRVREVFCSEIKNVGPRLRVNPEIVEPVMGALRMARDGDKG